MKEEGNMLATSKDDGANHDPDSSLVQEMGSAVASSAAPEASSIGSGLSIIGKIIGHGPLTVFGHVDGELHASTVVIAEGAQLEGELVAEELTIGGRVKGTIHANRVKLERTAVVEGDIFHQTLAIDENARFEGVSRRNENMNDTLSRVQTNRSQSQVSNGNPKGNGSSDALNP
jgi:cytoskeletal protein CcmA (bactofilin family)